LFLLSLTSLLHTVYLIVKAHEGLLAHLADSVEGVFALVHTVVVDGEGTLRTHELRNRRVVVVTDLLTVQGHFNVRQLVQDASGSLLTVRAHIIFVNLQALVLHPVALGLE